MEKKAKKAKKHTRATVMIVIDGVIFQSKSNELSGDSVLVSALARRHACAMKSTWAHVIL